MFSDEIRCCLLHLRYINIEITKFRVKPYERVRKLVVPDAILIRLDRIAKPRMKIIRHLARFLNPDIVRQPLVQREADLLRRNPCLRIKDCHISKRMHPGICPACANDLDILLQQLRQFPVQDFLNCNSIVLNLPATIICPVIRNG